MPMDYKRALREQADRRHVDSGEPAVIAEQYDGTGPVRAGQGEPYQVAGEGHQEAHDPGEAGQQEDAARAAERAGKRAKDAGRDEAERAEIEAEAEEEVLPFNG